MSAQVKISLKISEAKEIFVFYFSLEKLSDFFATFVTGSGTQVCMSPATSIQNYIDVTTSHALVSLYTLTWEAFRIQMSPLTVQESCYCKQDR